MRWVAGLAVFSSICWSDRIHFEENLGWLYPVCQIEQSPLHTDYDFGIPLWSHIELKQCNDESKWPHFFHDDTESKRPEESVFWGPTLWMYTALPVWVYDSSCAHKEFSLLLNAIDHASALIFLAKPNPHQLSSDMQDAHAFSTARRKAALEAAKHGSTSNPYRERLSPLPRVYYLTARCPKLDHVLQKFREADQQNLPRPLLSVGLDTGNIIGWNDLASKRPVSHSILVVFTLVVLWGWLGIALTMHVMGPSVSATPYDTVNLPKHVPACLRNGAIARLFSAFLNVVLLK